LLMATFLYGKAMYQYAPTLRLFAESKTTNMTLNGLALAAYVLRHVIIRMPVGA